jgi:signal transduction histidine kinase
MFSKRSNSRSGLLLRQTLPFWLCTIAFFFMIFCAITLVLRQHEQRKAQQLLHRFQLIYQQSGSGGVQLSYTAVNVGNASFLRLAGNGLRLIMVTHDGHDSNRIVPDFTSFSPLANRVWQSLQTGSDTGSWTVAATTLTDGTSLQVGITSTESLFLLRQTGKILLILLPLCLLLATVPAWLSMRRSSRIMDSLCQQIIDMADNPDQQLKLNRTASPGETALLAVLEQQMTRHRRLSRELRESMDNVAHDLRTPITRLRSIAEYGLHKSDDNEHLQEALADCLEESDRLLSMLNTMLNVAEAEADTVQLDLQPVSLEESISGVLDLYSIIGEEQGTAIHFTPAPGLMILADQQRISQVWANLVDNAIKYNAGDLFIGTERQGDMAKITIRDNGMGISENEISRIWDRLFRGDRSRSKPGLGLGLTLVRAMVNNHNGTVKVSSRLNEGTTFTVLLPLINPTGKIPEIMN